MNNYDVKVNYENVYSLKHLILKQNTAYTDGKSTININKHFVYIT